MSLLFLCYPKCTTCQKARRWLDEHNIAYIMRDIAKENPTKEELTQWIGQSKLPLKKFFNTSGLVYKELNLKDKLPTMSDEEKIDALSQNGMLVKRPIVVGEETVLVGFKEADWEQALL